jgi:hypothetical protein
MEGSKMPVGNSTNCSLSNPADEERLQRLLREVREDFNTALKMNEQTWLIQLQEAMVWENQRIMQTISKHVNASTSMLEQTLQMQGHMQSDLSELQKQMNLMELHNKQQLHSSKKQPKAFFQEATQDRRSHGRQTHYSKHVDLLDVPLRGDNDGIHDVESAFQTVRGPFWNGSSSEEIGSGFVQKASAPCIGVPDRSSKRQTMCQVPKGERASFDGEGVHRRIRRGKKMITSSRKSALRYKSEPVLSHMDMADDALDISCNANLEAYAIAGVSPVSAKSESGPFHFDLEDKNDKASHAVTSLPADRMAPTWHKPSLLHHETIGVDDPTKFVRANMNSQNMEVNTRSSDDAESSESSNPQDLPDVVRLFAAIERDDIESCKRCLQNQDLHDINQVNDKKLTILHKATLRGLPSVVKGILSHPKFTEANALMPGGLSALHCASFHGFREICDMLLSHRSFTMAFHVDDAGWTALDHAERFGGSAAGKTAFALRRHGLRRGRDGQ